MTSAYDRWLDEGLDEYMEGDEESNVICPYCDHDFYTSEIENIRCPECKRLILL